MSWQLAILYFVLSFIPLNYGKQCPPLPYVDLKHGRIESLGRDKFQFQCDEGYFLGGSEVIRCYKGNWTSLRPPTCYRAEGRCPAPENVPNADKIAADDTIVGSSVLYICHEGHIMLGEGQRTCLQTGGWSGITPACLNETEPLQNVAQRLDKQFVSLAKPKTNNTRQSRFLDEESLQRGLELVILLDRSSSVDPYDLEIGKDFIHFLLEEFNVKNGNNPLGARAAVLAFGTNVDVIFNLDNENITGPEAAREALSKVQAGGGGTAIVPAFATLYFTVLPLLRPEAKRAIFLITDGEPNVGGEGSAPEDIANQVALHERFEIFAVGIGRDINRQFMSRIASEPIINHVFLLDKFSDLREVMISIKNRSTEAPPPSLEKCGHLNEGFVPYGWAWMAAVYVGQQDVNTQVNETKTNHQINLCAGILICNQWVLTAASCFFHVKQREVALDLQETFVVLGEYNLLKNDSQQMNFYAQNVILHPEFDPLDNLVNNLALIKLNEEAPEDYRTLCLPPTDVTVPLHQNREINASVVGWGLGEPYKGIETISAHMTKFKLGTKVVAITSQQECEDSAQQRFPKNTVFCSGSGIHSPCTGNIGSPILAQDPNTGIHHALGILSGRKRCGTGYSQYTDLRKHIRWINEVTSKCHYNKHWN